MYLPTRTKRSKTRNRSARSKAKLKAKNRRRVNRMANLPLSRAGSTSRLKRES